MNQTSCRAGFTNITFTNQPGYDQRIGIENGIVLLKEYILLKRRQSPRLNPVLLCLGLLSEYVPKRVTTAV